MLPSACLKASPSAMKASSVVWWSSTGDESQVWRMNVKKGHTVEVPFAP